MRMIRKMKNEKQRKVLNTETLKKAKEK